MPRKKKGESLEALTRAKIAETLPRAIEHALDSYHEYAFKNNFTDTKTFSAYHGACKAAAAHIDLLLKLAQWAQLPRQGQDADLAALMQDAQSELARYREDNDDA